MLHQIAQLSFCRRASAQVAPEPSLPDMSIQTHETSEEAAPRSRGSLREAGASSSQRSHEVWGSAGASRPSPRRGDHTSWRAAREQAPETRGRQSAPPEEPVSHPFALDEPAGGTPSEAGGVASESAQPSRGASGTGTPSPHRSPTSWQVALAPDGRVYYYNTAGETRWASSWDWQQAESRSTGETYYVNAVTGERQWRIPNEYGLDDGGLQ